MRLTTICVGQPTANSVSPLKMQSVWVYSIQVIMWWGSASGHSPVMRFGRCGQSVHRRAPFGGCALPDSFKRRAHGARDSLSKSHPGHSGEETKYLLVTWDLFLRESGLPDERTGLWPHWNTVESRSITGDDPTNPSSHLESRATATRSRRIFRQRTD